ncbi:glycosyltransferase family 4 protein [Shewanella metallivivens]|uniref:Glycosyltransferase family 4 protein n=1 Tax=Shewanella metallivivens TaxID=2872342 RepID=A0ABT5THH7_9GAMM|nr:glycosyltransferase family 4 protein [Shewanella metallivivens]MDD8057633.1 glycosyltransferase family 4 protein [Shewanella metallivivens]
MAETLKGGIASVINVITLDDLSESFVCGPDEHEDYIESNNFIGFKGSSRGVFRTVLFVTAAVKAVFKIKPDIVHLHSSIAILVVPFIFPLKLTGNFKIVYQPHGVFYDPQKRGKNIIKNIIILIEFLLGKLVDKVIAISLYESKLLNKVFNSKTTVLYNPCTNMPMNLNLNSNLIKERYYLFIGRLDEQKGYDLLIKNWSFVSDSTLKIVGENVIGNFDKSKVTNENIIFLGWQNKDEISQLLFGAEALIVPSRWEGFGLVAIEAMAHGVPVIASNRGALPEIVTNDIGSIFELDNFSASLKESIAAIQQKDNVYLRNNCIAYSKKFNSTNYINELHNLYKKLSKDK